MEMVRLYFLGSKITAYGDCSHEIKRLFLLGRKVMNNLLLLLSRFSEQPRQHIKKQRRYVADKGPSSLSFCFPSIWTVVLEMTLESPLDCKEIQLVHPKGIQSWIFIGRTDAEAETLNTLATWCEELTHLKRPWFWERLRAGGKGDNTGWDGWMASPT